MRISRLLLGLFLAAALLCGTYLAGFGTCWLLDRARTQPSTAEAQNLKVFWEAWHLLDDEFLGEKPSAVQRAYGATHGMVATFNDPYTIFVEPQPRELERDELRGEFGGIGAWVGLDEEGHIVLTPMKDSPAAQAGIQEGDVVVAVDGQEVGGMTPEQVVALIRGPVGSTVRLTLRRAGLAEPLEFEIERQTIELPTVEYRLLEQDPKAGYVAIRLIGERTPDELKDALRDLRQQGAARLILDLRHNPGGALLASVDVASQFLPGGVVLYEQRKDGQEKPYYAARSGLALDWPLAVLVDAATASGAEIIAGALQDHGRARIIGEQTFGKGSVQNVHDLSDGSSLHVTVARWLTPHRHQIDGQGLTPDDVVPFTDEDRAAGRDPQLERAVAYLAEQAS
ncbi:MAG: S41 family peptidase [Anaerolineae bacterium]|nr:S41 family peptidase [Anaerolineae bacterium]